jgi:cysteine desulfurase
MASLYFDYNATRPLRDSAKQKIMECLNIFGNPSSIHKNGRTARGIIEDAREKIANFLNLSTKRLIFTSGATESNNTILHQFRSDNIYTSTQEHESINFSGNNFLHYRSLPSGLCDLNHMEDALRKKSSHGPTLVSMIAVNSETGIVQPLDEARDLAHRYGAYFHTDAVQGIGRTDFKWDSYDFLSFSGHKLGALPGVGVLVIPENYSVNTLLRGGGQEQSRRSGTENMVGIASLGAVVKDVQSECWKNAKQHRDFLEDTLIEKYPKINVIGKDEKRVDNTCLLTMPGVKSELQVISFDLADIRVSAGSACSSGKVKSSKVLKALGFPEEIAATTLRVSLPPDVSKDDVQKFINVWEKIYAQCTN